MIAVVSSGFSTAANANTYDVAMHGIKMDVPGVESCILILRRLCHVLRSTGKIMGHIGPFMVSRFLSGGYQKVYVLIPGH